MSVCGLLGALKTLGIGFYAPRMMVVSLMGMSPKPAFPIMMGSVAFVGPIAGVEFIRQNRYNLQSALGLLMGGFPGVLVAAFLVRSLPLAAIRWLMIAVVFYTAVKDLILREMKSQVKKGAHLRHVPARSASRCGWQH